MKDTLGICIKGWVLLLAVSIIIFAAMPALADETCTTGEEAALALPPLEPGQVRAVTKEGEWIMVRPLDDPENPYREHYGAWDKWFYANFDPELGFGDLPAG